MSFTLNDLEGRLTFKSAYLIGEEDNYQVNLSAVLSKKEFEQLIPLLRDEKQ